MRKVRSTLESYDKVVLLAGLGCDTGSTVSALITRFGKENEIQSTVITTLPFNFEGGERSRQSKAALQAILKSANKVQVFDLNKTLAFNKPMTMKEVLNYVNTKCVEALLKHV